MQLLYLCNIQTLTTANLKQIFVIQNILNQKVRDMEEKKITEAQVDEQTTSQDENKNVNELDAIKKELKSMTEEKQKFSTYWYEALADIRRYQTAVTKLVEELGWDQATAMGKIGEILGDDIWRVIEVNNSSRFNR